MKKKHAIDLRPGDIVMVDGQTWVVEQTIYRSVTEEVSVTLTKVRTFSAHESVETLEF